MDSVFRVVMGTRLDGAAQVELLFVQEVYFLLHSYVFAMFAHPLWHNYSAKFWPISGCLLNSGKFS